MRFLRYMLVLSLTLPLATSAGSVKDRRSKQVLEFFTKLEQGLFGEREFKKATKLLKKAQGIDRSWLVMALAQFQRTMAKEPIEGLKLLAPEVLSKSSSTKWLNELKTAENARIAKWRQAKADAYRKRTEASPRPTGLAAEFPAVGKFTVDESAAQLALEVGRCLMDLGKIDQALKVIDHYGRNYEGDGRVLAFEALGDLYLKMRMFEKCVESYKTGSKLLMANKPTEGLSKWQEIIKKRLVDKLYNANKFHDIERYGPGYVAYRAAETKRRKEKLYLEAIWLYDQIIKTFPKTVYSEASACYKLKCLLELATRRYPNEVERKTLDDVEKKLQKEEDFYKVAKRCKVPQASLDEIKATIERLEGKLAALKSIPYGKKALAAAKRIASDAMQTNRLGLHRGEMLLNLAEHLLVEELDPAGATPYLTQGLAWCQEVAKVDARVSLFSIPTRAREVATPPRSSIARDQWGNVEYKEPASGQVLNRKTTPWCLGLLQSQYLKYLGMLAFSQGDTDKARDIFESMLEIDERILYLANNKLPNMHSRLLLRCKQGTLRGASKVSLAAFKNEKRRFVVFLADFYAETEEPNKAAELYASLLDGKYGKLKAGEEAYTRFGLSWAQWYAGVRDEDEGKERRAIATLSRFLEDKRLQKTHIAPRAFKALGNMIRYNDTSAKASMRVIDLYLYVARKYPNSEYAQDCLYRIGADCLYDGQNNLRLRQKGTAALRELLREYPDSAWSELAQERLRKYGITENRDAKEK